MHQLELVEKKLTSWSCCASWDKATKISKKELISSTGHGLPLLRYCRKLTIASNMLTKPSFWRTLPELFVLCENLCRLPMSFSPLASCAQVGSKDSVKTYDLWFGMVRIRDVHWCSNIWSAIMIQKIKLMFEIFLNIHIFHKNKKLRHHRVRIVLSYSTHLHFICNEVMTILYTENIKNNLHAFLNLCSVRSQASLNILCSHTGARQIACHITILKCFKRWATGFINIKIYNV